MDRFNRRSALGLAGLLLVAGGFAWWLPRRGEAEVRGAAPRAPEAGSWLSLPPRPAGAITGSELVKAVAEMHPLAREKRIADELLAGNIPEHMRTLVPVELTIDGHVAVIRVTPDYLAVGSDEDFVRVPMSPNTAQRIADAAGCVLPTPRIADAIHAAARVKVPTLHIELGPDGGTSQDFAAHNRLIQDALAHEQHRPGELIAGHKKDVVITPRLATRPGHVAIYGMHQPDGTPLQVLSLVHIYGYYDYSHGIRLVAPSIRVDGVERPFAEVLRDPVLSALVSDEGPFELPRYPAE